MKKKIECTTKETIVLMEHSKGEKVSDISKKHKIARSTIYYWLNLNKSRTKKDGTIVSLKLFNELSAKYKNLLTQIEIIYTLDCVPSTPLHDKLRIIENHLGEYSVKAMCDILKVSTGTFYNYHLRRSKKTIQKEKKERLTKMITQIFRESDNRFGMDKITEMLKHQGEIVSNRTVSKIMKENNLKSKIIIRKKRGDFVKRKLEQSPNNLNKLNRKFQQEHPNTCWISDVTTVFIKGNPFHICVVLDLFSRKAVGYSISPCNNTKLVIIALKHAFDERNEPKNLMFHSDRGSNYTSFEFSNLLTALGIIHSLSNPGNPYDNACMESFFSKLKSEEIKRRDYTTLLELRESIQKYIFFYNQKRPHSSLGYLTPNQFEEKYYKGLY